MAEFATEPPDLNFEITIKLTESEARALYAITTYGDDAFLKQFYAHLGQHYLKPHEAGLRSLFASIKKFLKWQLKTVDSIRDFSETIKRA